jgi:hypothetical protein
MLSEPFEELPGAGDPPKPKLVFFFDEAHLLFNDAPVVVGVAGRLGKSVGGQLGGTVGRAIVRGTLGGLLRRWFCTSRVRGSAPIPGLRCAPSGPQAQGVVTTLRSSLT